MASNGLQIDNEAFKRLSPAEQRELRDLLADVTDLAAQNPLTAYIPYPKQKQFHSAEERVRGFIGGNRAGKSSSGVADDLIQVLSPEMVPEHLRAYKKYGWDEPAKVRVITPDLGHTMQVAINKFREFTPRNAIVGGEWRKAFDRTRRVLSFENGSIVDFMSTEQDPDKFGGVDLHRVHYDEEPSGPNAETIWQESRWRLLDHGGDIILTMTPLFGASSLIHDAVWEQRHKDGTFCIQASVWDNPFIPKHEVEAAIRGMSEEERRARVLGEFVHFEGLFYPEFSDSLHVKEPKSPNEIRNLDAFIVGIDPGIVRTAILWVAFDSDNGAFAFDEHYPQGDLPPELAVEIRRRNARWGIEPDYYVIDPTARARSSVNAEQIESAFAREGIFTIHGQNARGPGIMEVKRRLQHGMLTVSSDLRNLIWEFGRYRKDPNSQDEFAAIKEDDHLMDALRYICMSRPWVFSGDTPPDEFVWEPGIAPPMDQLMRGKRGPNPPLGAMS